jgi:hypothetical protein
VRGLFLAGPLCFFFLNMSLGGFYGVKLIDLDLIDQPGIIFTIVAGIGSSAVQFAKARAQFKPFLPAHHAPQMYVHDGKWQRCGYGLISTLGLLIILVKKHFRESGQAGI